MQRQDDIARTNDRANRARQRLDAVLVANELAMFVELDGHFTTSSNAAARSETHPSSSRHRRRHRRNLLWRGSA
jgi:hypothetical protein